MKGKESIQSNYSIIYRKRIKLTRKMIKATNTRIKIARILTRKKAKESKVLSKILRRAKYSSL